MGIECASHTVFNQPKMAPARKTLRRRLGYIFRGACGHSGVQTAPAIITRPISKRDDIGRMVYMPHLRQRWPIHHFLHIEIYARSIPSFAFNNSTSVAFALSLSLYPFLIKYSLVDRTHAKPTTISKTTERPAPPLPTAGLGLELTKETGNTFRRKNMGNDPPPLACKRF